MSVYIPYIIVVIFCAAAVFASLSRGSLFTETVKACFIGISLLALLGFCIYVAVCHSWVHIIGLLFEYAFAARTFGAFFSDTIFRHTKHDIPDDEDSPQ